MDGLDARRGYLLPCRFCSVVFSSEGVAVVWFDRFVVGDLDVAATFADRALVLNPNLAGAWYASGWVRVFLGESDVAIKHFAQAMRLSPLDPHTIGMQAGTAFAHFLAGRFDEASLWAGKAMWENTNYLTTIIIAAASNALAGRPAEAQKIMVRLRELAPTLRVSNVKDWARFADRKTSQSLRKAYGKPACRNKTKVRYWHLADMDLCAANVRFRG